MIEAEVFAMQDHIMDQFDGELEEPVAGALVQKLWPASISAALPTGVIRQSPGWLGHAWQSNCSWHDTMI